ncbi:biotin/lipoyl-containing protein [Vallitalea guaymasensis]|uniref:Biotin/lipoyl-binding protein n=1 Tax=Vallitalea guaymasensis TaxID=1185412 RepID=A0A8J8SEQ0_9FIRM|nr:biotin/lipoyl-containing protein [Vallitalea guaymasensis]QUH31780.1 biotin/lipoyl-binding protein [Vallitalea guaymasensis]
MRNFQVTVNGNTYVVAVEELGNGQVATPVVSAPKAVPNKAAAPAKKPAAASAPAGATKVTAPMQGKIVDVKVSNGQQVQAGDVLAILEAMKMENEVVAPAAGTVASVNVSAGQSVETGDLIVSLN